MIGVTRLKMADSRGNARDELVNSFKLAIASPYKLPAKLGQSAASAIMQP